MYWADELAQKLKERNFPLEWVDDMKTPSGRVHVGSLRGVVVHDLVHKALKDAGISTKYTFIFDNHDPMDDVPSYLPEEYKQYLGLPLFKVPSPEKGYDNYPEFFAKEFQHVFNTIGCNPEIIWATDLYKSGKMNPVIKEVLDKAQIIRDIYSEMYKKEIASNWYPFQPYCPQCGKVSTTNVTDWDGEQITFTCDINRVKWTQGCGYSGKMSPFSDQDHIAGKLPWKVEWPAKWKVLGITVEGAGKDHMTSGGSHDVAEQICKKVLNSPVPYPFAYEWFVLGGRKMSTSKGVGASAIDMLEILPPELIRFLMVRTDYQKVINFDLAKGDTVPNLFDEYQRCAQAFENKTEDTADFARIFELSQINGIKMPPKIRFSVLAQLVQMPNMQEYIKKEGLEEWARYARVWVEKYAPENEKFLVQKDLPEKAKSLTLHQKEFLQKVSSILDHDWEAEAFQTEVYNITKQMSLQAKEAFAAIYAALIGKDHGPKAAWLILSLDKKFVKKRFAEVTMFENTGEDKQSEITNQKDLTLLNKQDIFYIDQKVKEVFPSISIGVAIIKGVQIEKTNPELEKAKETLLSSFENQTTEELNQYPEIASYRKLYKEMGVDWHSRRPSPEALLRRVLLKKGLYTINTCVDAYNLVVMKHRVSVGAFDLDTLEMPTVMRFPKKGEEILLLGDTEPTQYTEKELAYFDQKGGFNLDFNYRDSQKTAVQLHTKNIYINVDGIYDISPEKIQQILQETCDIIMKYCGGTVELFGIEKAS